MRLGSMRSAHVCFDTATGRNRPGDRMAFSPGKLFRAATRRWFGPLAGTERIVKVTVRDADSHVIRVIESERDLAAFRALWAGLVETDPGASAPPPERPYYKLAIQWIGRGDRGGSPSWFYFPGGYIELLAIWRAISVAPLYRTPSPDAFEALLGADPSLPDQTRQ
jgi:hypothetical protein